MRVSCSFAKAAAARRGIFHCKVVMEECTEFLRMRGLCAVVAAVHELNPNQMTDLD